MLGQKLPLQCEHGGQREKGEQLRGRLQRKRTDSRCQEKETFAAYETSVGSTAKSSRKTKVIAQSQVFVFTVLWIVGFTS
jgi:hypothetical protein